jgi:hypothetical protein
MKNFFQWAEEKKLELPKISEATKRGGIAHWAYPDAYARQQYPDGYFTPYAADAVFKMGNKKVDRKAAPGGEK